MKSKFLLSLILVFLSIYSWGQTMNEPFKKANTILIETKAPSKEIYIKWGRHLAQNGYTIDFSNDDMLILKTGTRQISVYGNYFYRVTSAINDSGTIIIKMDWGLNNTNSFRTWEYASNKLNVQQDMYLDIIKVINSFGSYEIKFSS